MSEKEAVKQLQDLISDFNVSNGFDVRANATDIKAIFNFRTYKKMRLQAIRNIRIHYDNELKNKLLKRVGVK